LDASIPEFDVAALLAAEVIAIMFGDDITSPCLGSSGKLFGIPVVPTLPKSPDEHSIKPADHSFGFCTVNAK
jgi:hypothetical protein